MLPISPNITVRSVATPRVPETSAELAAIKQAMARHDDNAVQQQLALATLTPDAVQDLLKYAVEHKSSPAIKEALLAHPGCDLPSRQTALALAVQHNDIPFAILALKAGADPQPITAPQKDKEMCSLLTYARRKNKLYPPDPGPLETALDHALRNGLDKIARKDAWNLWLDAASSKHGREIWRDAVKAKQLDIQRATLLLYADRNRSFRMLQDEAVTDPGVAAVMKEIPYFSPKRKLPQNFNFAATFLDQKKEIITCRHLVEHRQSVQERHPQLKFEDAHFASTEAIAANVSYNTDANFKHLVTHAAEAHLFHNSDVGKALVRQLAAMKDRGESSRLILLSSTVHAMSVGLKRKEKDGQPRYVVEFFDPNETTSHVRFASDSLSTLEALTLQDLIDGEDQYNDYYPQPDGLSMMFVRPSPPPEEHATTGPACGAIANRTLTSGIADKDINATALFFLLIYGFGGELQRLTEEIARRPAEERFALLTAKDDMNRPGLHMALQQGHADAIKAFEALLVLVPEAQRAKLLEAKRADGTTGLYMALQEGHADAIRAFRALLAWVPEAQCAALLAAKDADENPGLYFALQDGQADAIRAFGEPLQLVPKAQRAALLAAKHPTGTPGLFKALQKGHADAIRAFGTLLPLVPPAQRVALLVAKNATGMPGLAVALEVGKLEAVEQYMEIVKKTAPALSAQDRAALLKEIRESHGAQREGKWCNFPHYEALIENNPDFHVRFQAMENALLPLMPKESRNIASELSMALDNGDPDAIRAFGKQLERVPPEQRAALLAAKDARNSPWLYTALENGDAEAIQAFAELLDRVPEAQRAELVAAKYAGDPGLFIALQKGDPATIKAFGELLKRVPQEQRAELLAAKDVNGAPGLYAALMVGKVDAIKAFGDLLSLIPPEQRAELLGDKETDQFRWLSRALQEGQPDAIKAFDALWKLAAPEQQDELPAVTTPGTSGLPRS